MTLTPLNQDAIRLQQEEVVHQRRVDRLVTMLRRMVLLLKLSGFICAGVQISERVSRLWLFQAIDWARMHFSVRSVLCIIGLSQAR